MAAAREAARVAGLRADRQQKIVNRRQTLRNLWRTELQNDRSLLHKPWDPQAAGAGADIPRPYNLRPWLKIKSFDNSPYILEEISKYVKSRLSQADRDELDDFYNDQSFDRNDVFLGFKDDVLDVEPDDGIGLVAAVMQEEQEDNSSPELWVQVQTLLELLARLRVMRRFADGRNSELPSAPLPDGSNIPRKHHSLITAWVLHRAWIRALHYRTLKIGDYALGFHHMKDILKLSLALYALELKDVSYDPVSDQNNLAGFGWIRKIHSQVEKALIALSRYLDTETRSGRNGYTYSQGATIAYNLDPNRLGAAIQQILSTLDPRWELWSAILQKAAALEKASDGLHVENVEVEKRVVLDDEMFYVMGEMNDPNYDARGFYNTPEPAVEEDEETVLTHLQRISEMNRLRRNKLLLTNWNESGPWKQLYVMFDTSPTGKPDFVTLISKFWDRADKLQTHFLPPNGPPGPSNSGNIWSKLFPIHPLASTDAPDPTRLGAYYDKGKCVICYEDFPDTCDRVLMRLKCDHWYHFTCIRNMWDQPDNYSYPCPMCRLTPHNWRLHEHAGITPEVRALDVWDFEELMSPGHIFGEPGKDPHPDLTVYYHNEDEMHFNMAMTFTRQHGYTNIDPLEPDNQALWRIGKGGVDEFRAPRTEMAVLRRKRRDRNKKRKDLMITARKGFEGLDPEEEDALDG